MDDMHQHNHKHQHGQLHSHNHNQSDTKNIGIVFFLNLAFTLIELVGGILTNSVAILSDALHDLGDSLSLGISWYLSHISEKKPSKKFSYGYRRFSLLAALINSFILVIGSTIILFEAIPRLFHPEMPHAQGMMYLAILGILVNGAAVVKLKGSNSLNARVVGFHMLEDVLGWVAVLIVSLVLMWVELPILDPILSVAFTCYILWNVIKVLNQTVYIFLQAVPDSIDLPVLKNRLNSLPQVDSCHDTHLWTLDGEHHVLSTHLKTNNSLDTEERLKLRQSVDKLLQEHSINHSTVEIEFPDDDCRMKVS